MPTVSQAKFMNKFKEGFYFEKYKTAEEAKNVLLNDEIPVQATIIEKLKTLEAQLATNGSYDETYWKKAMDLAWCQYDAALYAKNDSLLPEVYKRSTNFSVEAKLLLTRQCLDREQLVDLL